MSWLDDISDYLFGGSSSGDQSLSANYGDTSQSAGSDNSNFFTSAGSSFGDLAESFALTFGDQLSGGAGYAVNSDAFTPKTADAGNTGVGLIDRVGSWVEKNPGLTKLGGLFVQGAIGGSDKKNAAEALAASRLAELREQDRLKQEHNAKFSQSVAGLRKPGLIGAAPLKRSNGQPIFNNGQLVR